MKKGYDLAFFNYRSCFSDRIYSAKNNRMPQMDEAYRRCV